MTRYILLFLLASQSCFGQINTFHGKKLDVIALDKQIKHAMDSLQVQGMSLAIINDGKIVFNKGFGVSNTQLKKKVTESTLFEAASLSKPVFALFVLKLAKAGKIDIDKPLFEYLPANNIVDDRYKKVTARMVLNHTTGLPNWSETEKIHLLSKPGTQFSYSGEAFMYLAKVIAKLYDTSLENLDNIFQREVARELHLKNFHFITTQEIEKNLALGYQKNQKVEDERNRLIFDPAGGLYANTLNYATFLIWLMNNALEYKEMFLPVISLEQGNPIMEYFGVDSWTLGMAFIHLGGTKNYWHGGNNLGFTSSFMINLEKQFGYVYFTNEDQCNGMKKVIEDILWR
ncbi:serine hydrolase domain-containing protein [Sphingobacterium gobiense]|uniref:Beta-lactamase-related domain-containing protein n=1 Tax=Sphingobacterium gobiense TaxID=1382456 RepID=A0A2S9JU45_9SPHI|nr:serine hydrolase domain-containing protein [Sphingobacterium gobiense]PRD56805.1 hypothetical protein C5749_06160 [Sphingobacterium gobiense]